MGAKPTEDIETFTVGGLEDDFFGDAGNAGGAEPGVESPDEDGVAAAPLVAADTSDVEFSDPEMSGTAAASDVMYVPMSWGAVRCGAVWCGGNSANWFRFLCEWARHPCS